MKTLYCCFVATIFFATAGCSSWKQALKKEGRHNDAVENAITDFLQTCKKLNKEDKTFYILIQNVNKKLYLLESLEIIVSY